MGNRWLAFKAVEMAVPICSWASCKLLTIQSMDLILPHQPNEITVIAEFPNVKSEQAEFEECEHVIIL